MEPSARSENCGVAEAGAATIATSGQASSVPAKLSGRRRDLHLTKAPRKPGRVSRRCLRFCAGAFTEAEGLASDENDEAAACPAALASGVALASSFAPGDSSGALAGPRGSPLRITEYPRMAPSPGLLRPATSELKSFSPHLSASGSPAPPADARGAEGFMPAEKRRGCTPQEILSQRS